MTYRELQGHQSYYSSKDALAYGICTYALELWDLNIELSERIEQLEDELSSLEDFTSNQGWLKEGLSQIRQEREA